jgi:hypothetical protein
VEPTYKHLFTSHNTLELTLLHEARTISVRKGSMCTRAHPDGRAWRCDFGVQGIANGIIADPCSCAYMSVFGYRAHDMCGPEMGHMA